MGITTDSINIKRIQKGNMMRTVEIKQLTLEHCLGLGASSSVQLKIQVTCSLPLLLLLLLLSSLVWGWKRD